MSKVKNLLSALSLLMTYHPWLRKLIIITTAPAVLLTLLYLTFPVAISIFHKPVTLAPQHSGFSRVLDDTSNVIAVVHNPETLYRYDAAIPLNLKEMLLYQEDRNFYKHKGFDLVGTFRALYSNIKGNPVQGGSTITQQLVRNRTDIGSSRNYSRKIKELLSAVKLEQAANKSEILREYINSIYMGNGVRGLYTASKIWFNKELRSLTLYEKALLVSTIPCPETCNPVDNPETAKVRAEKLINSLEKTGLVKVDLNQKLVFPKVRSEMPSKKATGDPWVIDAVRREMQRLNLLEFKGDTWPGGYDIHTTINPTLQESLADSVLKVMGDPATKSLGLDTGGAFVKNGTGEVKALIGSRDFTNNQVNLALGSDGGGSGRQIGSTAKVLTVLAAFEKGLTHEYQINAPSLIQVGGKPVRNYDGNNWGMIDMHAALTWSVNTYFTALAKEVSPSHVSSVARKLGLNFPNYKTDERITLGVTESSPLQLSSAYAAIASDGLWVSPYLVSKITRGDKKIYEALPEKRQSISKENAQYAQSLLRSVINYGTGYRAKLQVGSKQIDVIGKTGTTDNAADIWFVGSTKDITGAIWIGNPKSNTYINSVPGYPHSGSGAPAEIWRRTLQSNLVVTEDFPSLKLPYPNKPAFNAPLDEVATVNDDDLNNNDDGYNSNGNDLNPNLPPESSPSTETSANPQDTATPQAPTPQPSPTPTTSTP